MSSLVNTLRRCHSTVRALMNSCAPISGFDRPSPGEPGNLGFLGCELLARLGAALADLLPGSDQFPAGALGERLHPDRGEQVVGGAQLLARVDASTLAAQPFAVARPSSGRTWVRPTRSIASRYKRSALSPLVRSARERASMPWATSVPDGWVVSSSRSSASRASSVSPTRAAASTSSGSAQTDTPGSSTGATGRPNRDDEQRAETPRLPHRGRRVSMADWERMFRGNVIASVEERE
jgi:hypothetical protein